MGSLPHHRLTRAHAATHRLVATLLAMLVALCTVGCTQTPAGDAAAALDQLAPSTLAIVHTGSINGSYAKSDTTLGIAAIPSIASELRQQGHEVLVMDSGNSLGGSSLVDLTDGEDAVGYMNAAGYDCMCLDYQELALGSERLNRRISQSDFAYLSANVTAPASKRQAHQAHHQFALADGKLVGIFGLSAPLVTDSLPPLAASQFRSSENTLATDAQEQVAALRKQGCSLVICLANLGYDDSGELRAEQLCSQVDGIDLLLDASAHQSSHKTIKGPSEHDTLLVETAGGLQEATVATWADGSFEIRTIDPSCAPAPNEQCNALITQAQMVLDEARAKKLATCSAQIDVDASQKASCGLGALTAQAIYWDATHGGSAKADGVVIDATLLRKGLPEGDIRFDDVLASLPHASGKLCALRLTGEQLQKALAPLLTSSHEPLHAMPQIAGITIEERGEGDEAKRTITKVGDKAFSASDTYTIATCEGLLAYPNSLSEFDDGKTELIDLNSSADTALSAYLASECKDGIPQQYATGA